MGMTEVFARGSRRIADAYKGSRTEGITEVGAEGLRGMAPLRRASRLPPPVDWRQMPI